MATVTHAYNVTDTVFHMDPILGVREAVVRGITITIVQSGTTINYDIVFARITDGSAIVTESVLYADVDAALAAYRPTVLI